MLRHRPRPALTAAWAAVLGLFGPAATAQPPGPFPPFAARRDGVIRPALAPEDRERVGVEWFRQGRFLRALAFSPDGRIMASAGRIRTIVLRDVATGEVVAQLPSPDNGAWALAFSPDGGRLAVAWESRAIGVFDVGTQALIWRSNDLEQSDSRALAFSPDGRLLASRLTSEKVQIWDADTGEMRQAFAYGHNESSSDIASVAFSPDGRFLAAGGYRNGVKVWDVATGAQVRALNGPTGWVYAVAFSPDGRFLAAGCPGGTARIWDTATGKEAHTLRVPGEDDVEMVAFLPGGKTLLAAGYDRRIRLWDVATGQEEGSVRLAGPSNFDRFMTIALAPDCWVAESSGRDGTVRVYDLGAAIPGKAATAGPEALWTDLGAAEPLTANRAVAVLATKPGPALELMRERLRPATLPETHEFDALLDALDSNRYAERQHAEAELRRLGVRVEPALRRLLADDCSAEARARAGRLLEGIRPSTAPPADADGRRALRAVVVLGRIGTPEARAMLERMATGSAGAPQTAEAKALLGRLPAL